MRHTEVSESPCKSGYYILPGSAEHSRSECTGNNSSACICICIYLLKLACIYILSCNNYDRNGKQRDKHKYSLKEISPAYCLESSEEGISDYNKRKDDHCGMIGHIREKRREYRCSGNKRTCYIYRKCDKEYYRTYYLQSLMLCCKSVCKILRKCDCIICCLTEFSESLCT